MPFPAESSPVPNNNIKVRERNSGRVDRGELLTQPNPGVDGDQQTASLDVGRLECSHTWIVRLSTKYFISLRLILTPLQNYVRKLISYRLCKQVPVQGCLWLLKMTGIKLPGKSLAGAE